jgi:uncharacterized surface protein with fasciclin (FAS1) repeats
VKILGATTSLLLASTLLATACTITPAVPPDGGTDTPAAATETGITETTTTDSATTTGAGDADTVSEETTATAGTAVTDTAAITTTTTVLTTTVTTLTEGATLTETQVITGAADTGTSSTAAALPTPTQVAGITVTTPVSPPVAAEIAAATAATTVVTDAGAGTIFQVISTTAGLETLAAALTASGVSTALEQPGPLTFFAPTNDAFAVLPQDQLDALLADPTTLTPILQYHIVIDNVAAAHLGTLGAALSSSGQPITVTVQGDGSVLVNDARIVQPDIPAANGAIHLIDKVLVPPPSSP